MKQIRQLDTRFKIVGAFALLFLTGSACVLWLMARLGQAAALPPVAQLLKKMPMCPAYCLCLGPVAGQQKTQGRHPVEHQAQRKSAG